MMPKKTDFKCGLLQADLPPSDEAESDKQQTHFVKEISTDAGTLRVDCEIVEGTDTVFPLIIAPGP